MKDDDRRLGVVEFSRWLLETGDLDPLYVILWEADMPRSMLCRWLLAYFCFYSAGLACWIMSQPNYWAAMARIPEQGTRYPRGAERRHFRGRMAIEAVHRLRTQYPEVEKLFGWLEAGGPTAGGVMQRVKQLYGFGEWISWKVPDMCERLGVMQVKFVDRDVDLMFASSLEGAKETAARWAPSNDPLMSAHQYLINQIGSYRSPPRRERAINVQETETCFCKWKSHLGGHYPLGKDTVEIFHGLTSYAHCRVTQKLLRPALRLRETVQCRM